MNIPFPSPAAARRRPLTQKTVTLAHGGGGSAMRDLIDDVFLSAFSGEGRAAPEDQARFDLAALMARVTASPSPPTASWWTPCSFPAATSASSPCAAR